MSITVDTGPKEVDWDKLDPGIVSAVRALRAAGFDTFTSCQGGKGHARRIGWVRFHVPGGLLVVEVIRKAAAALQAADIAPFTVTYDESYNPRLLGLSPGADPSPHFRCYSVEFPACT